jgi:hypothetical protein
LYLVESEEYPTLAFHSKGINIPMSYFHTEILEGSDDYLFQYDENAMNLQFTMSLIGLADLNKVSVDADGFTSSSDSIHYQNIDSFIFEPNNI